MPRPRYALSVTTFSTSRIGLRYRRCPQTPRRARAAERPVFRVLRHKQKAVLVAVELSIFRAISAGSPSSPKAGSKVGSASEYRQFSPFDTVYSYIFRPLSAKDTTSCKIFYLYQIIANTCKLQILAKRKYIRCVWYFRLAIFQTSKIRCSARLLYCVSGFSRNSGFFGDRPAVARIDLRCKRRFLHDGDISLAVLRIRQRKRRCLYDLAAEARTPHAWRAPFPPRAPGPFIAAKIPFILMSGIQYSASVFILATARAVAMSKLSRSFTSRPASSARLWMQFASTPIAAQTSFRNIRRLLSESSNVSSMSGRMILTGRPGKPAPVPTSTSFAPFLISTAFKSVRLSTKCLTTASWVGDRRQVDDLVPLEQEVQIDLKLLRLLGETFTPISFAF